EIYGKIALTGESFHFENEAKALGRHYDVFAYRVGGPDSRKVAILFNDVTERKRAEEALRRSREEFKELFEQAPFGYHELDAAGRFVRINQAELKMLGRTAEELVGQFVWTISAEEERSRQ